jgi:predicted phosphohydrolase
MLLTMRIVCLSDTHGRHGQLSVPEGDVLVHAGDFSMAGRTDEIERFDRWLGTLPHPHKVVVAGNHDFLFERDPERARALLGNASYLQDGLLEVEGLRIWGSPWQPWFFDWAFNLPRGPELAAKWALVPDGVDVLVTHGPPAEILDFTASGEAVGCHDLARALERIRPRLHVFGHIHEAYGRLQRDGTTFVNASNCNLMYRAVQAPIVVEL